MTSKRIGTLWSLVLTALVLLGGVPMLIEERGAGAALLLGGLVVGFIWLLRLVVGQLLERAVREQVEREVERRSLQE